MNQDSLDTSQMSESTTEADDFDDFGDGWDELGLGPKKSLSIVEKERAEKVN